MARKSANDSRPLSSVRLSNSASMPGRKQGNSRPNADPTARQAGAAAGGIGLWRPKTGDLNAGCPLRSSRPRATETATHRGSCRRVFSRQRCSRLRVGMRTESSPPRHAAISGPLPVAHWQALWCGRDKLLVKIDTSWNENDIDELDRKGTRDHRGRAV